MNDGPALLQEARRAPLGGELFRRPPRLRQEKVQV